MAAPAYQAKYFTAAEIRRHGAVGNLNEGVTIRTHGIDTRLIAWPGNGYTTESVHVLTLQPGEASASYAYTIAEELLLCVAGRGEVFLSERWVSVEPGDMPYFPEGVVHAIRNPAGNIEDFVLVSQIAPPQFDLYAEAGFYQVANGTMNFSACFRAGLNAPSGNIRTPLAFACRDTEPDVRSWNRSIEQIRREGALFNVFKGSPLAVLGSPAVLVAWPGAGSRLSGFNFCYSHNEADLAHTHPVSDECLILWAGTSRAYMGEPGKWIDVEALDCLLAPAGVFHTPAASPNPTFWGGFASPPQLDLILKTDYYKDGVCISGPVTELTYPRNDETRDLFAV